MSSEKCENKADNYSPFCQCLLIADLVEMHIEPIEHTSCVFHEHGFAIHLTRLYNPCVPLCFIV